MNKKSLFLIIALLIIAGYYLVHNLNNSNISSAEQAVSAMKEKVPGLADYPSDNLPPKRVVTEKADKGWLVGLYTQGSGLPGILMAKCYFVSTKGKIALMGEFAANGKAGPVSLDLTDCTPQFEAQLSYFSDSVIRKVKEGVEKYETMGLGGNVDGFVLVKAYPNLQPSDFEGVQAKGGGYSVQNGKLMFTGNAASDSGVLTREGMRTLLKNVSKRLERKITSKENVDALLEKLSR